MSVSFFSGLDSTPEHLQLNFSNANAVDYLQAIGSDFDIEQGYGSIPFSDLPVFMMNLTRVRNTEINFLLEPRIIGGNFIECGRTLEQVDRSLKGLQDLVVFCFTNKTSLEWA